MSKSLNILEANSTMTKRELDKQRLRHECIWLNKTFMNMVKIHELPDQFSSTYIDSKFLGAKQTDIWVSDMDANNNSNVNACYISMLRKMVRGGYKRKEGEWGYKITNEKIINM